MEDEVEDLEPGKSISRFHVLEKQLACTKSLDEIICTLKDEQFAHLFDPSNDTDLDTSDMVYMAVRDAYLNNFDAAIARMLIFVLHTAKNQATAEDICRLDSATSSYLKDTEDIRDARRLICVFVALAKISEIWTFTRALNLAESLPDEEVFAEPIMRLLYETSQYEMGMDDSKRFFQLFLSHKNFFLANCSTREWWLWIIVEMTMKGSLHVEAFHQCRIGWEMENILRQEDETLADPLFLCLGRLAICGEVLNTVDVNEILALFTKYEEEETLINVLFFLENWSNADQIVLYKLASEENTKNFLSMLENASARMKEELLAYLLTITSATTTSCLYLFESETFLSMLAWSLMNGDEGLILLTMTCIFKYLHVLEDSKSALPSSFLESSVLLDAIEELEHSNTQIIRMKEAILMTFSKEG